MSLNFQINSYNFEDILFLRLSGIFDEDSAHKLINKLIEHRGSSLDIFVDTNELMEIHPFNRNIFQKNLDTFKKQFKNFFIIGINKHRFEQGLEQ